MSTPTKPNIVESKKTESLNVFDNREGLLVWIGLGFQKCTARDCRLLLCEQVFIGAILGVIPIAQKQLTVFCHKALHQHELSREVYAKGLVVFSPAKQGALPT